jgi:hypothetical protein
MHSNQTSRVERWKSALFGLALTGYAGGAFFWVFRYEARTIWFGIYCCGPALVGLLWLWLKLRRERSRQQHQIDAERKEHV